MVQGGLTPDASPEVLQSLGYAIAIYPANLLMAAAKGMIAALQHLGGTTPEVTATGIEALFELVGLREWSVLGDAWTRVQA